MNNEIFEKTQAVIKERRIRAVIENDRRISEINEKIPQIKEINEVIFNTGRQLISVIGAGNREDIEKKIQQLKRDNLDAQSLSRQKLVENGYPPDYLDIQYTCKKCNDTGYFNNSMCECFNKLYGKLSSDEINRYSHLDSSSFDTFSLAYYSGEDYNTMSRIFEYTKNYAENFRYDSKSIIMYGKTGLGKTHLSLAIANKVLEKGYSVIYDSAINILHEIEKEHFSYNKKFEMTDLVLQTDLLILDDLGTEKNSDFYTSAIYNIVNTRINKRKPTIISTNLMYESMNKRYEARLISRLHTHYAILHFVGNDVRFQKKLERTQRN